MLADFAMRMVFGLAVSTSLVSSRISFGYFRTVCLVMLGLATLAVPSSWADGGARGWRTGAAFAAAVGAYVGATAWALGFSLAGRSALAAVATASAIGLLAAARGAVPDAAGRGASGLVMGATLAAMLLGHQYLTEPTAGIAPLRRAIAFAGLALTLRAAMALLAWRLGLEGAAAAWPFAAVRWGIGLVGPAAAIGMAWKAAGIRSTQSATGLLYAALGLVLFGELASLATSRDGSALV